MCSVVPTPVRERMVTGHPLPRCCHPTPVRLCWLLTPRSFGAWGEGAGGVSISSFRAMGWSWSLCLWPPAVTQRAQRGSLPFGQPIATLQITGNSLTNRLKHNPIEHPRYHWAFWRMRDEVSMSTSLAFAGF